VDHRLRVLAEGDERCAQALDRIERDALVGAAVESQHRRIQLVRDVDRRERLRRRVRVETAVPGQPALILLLCAVYIHTVRPPRHMPVMPKLPGVRLGLVLDEGDQRGPCPRAIWVSARVFALPTTSLTSAILERSPMRKKGRGYGDLSKIADVKEVVGKANTLADTQMLADMDALVAFVENQPKANTRKLGITGMCRGGRTVWMYTAHSNKIKAGVSWYGGLNPNPLRSLSRRSTSRTS